MASTYSGNDGNVGGGTVTNPPTFTIPSDGDPLNAASVNAALQKAADYISQLQKLTSGLTASPIAMLRFDSSTEGGDTPLGGFTSGGVIFASFTSAKAVTVGTGITSNNTSRLTVSIAGTYRAAASLSLSTSLSAVSTSMQLHVRKSGSAYAGLGSSVVAAPTGAPTVHVSGQVLLSMVATDYVEMSFDSAPSGGTSTVVYAYLLLEKVG